MSLGQKTIHPTPLITLTIVKSLSQLSFNLISMSKLTRTLNCSISFFPGYCLIQDILMKRILLEDVNLGVSTSLKHRCQSLLLF